MTHSTPDTPPPVCVVCAAPSVTIDLYCGHRCVAHPPTFVPEVAVRLAVTGRLGAAYGYCRSGPDVAGAA